MRDDNDSVDFMILIAIVFFVVFVGLYSSYENSDETKAYRSQVKIIYDINIGIVNKWKDDYKVPTYYIKGDDGFTYKVNEEIFKFIVIGNRYALKSNGVREIKGVNVTQ